MLAERERVCILAGGDAVISEAQRMVGDLPGVALYDIPTDDAWCRDFGPMFLAGPAADPPALIDWRFNSWGGKYPPFDNDEAAAFHEGRRKVSRIADRRSCDRAGQSGPCWTARSDERSHHAHALRWHEWNVGEHLH